MGSAVGTAFLALRRTYRAVDNVITAVDNQTVELVHVVGLKSMDAATTTTSGIKEVVF